MNSQLSDSEWLIIIIIKKNSIFFNEDVNEQTNKYDPTLRVKYLKKNNRLCTSSEVQTYPWHCSLISTFSEHLIRPITLSKIISCICFYSLKSMLRLKMCLFKSICVVSLLCKCYNTYTIYNQIGNTVTEEP
jgi:hypothetical protein